MRDPDRRAQGAAQLKTVMPRTKWVCSSPLVLRLISSKPAYSTARAIASGPT